MSSLPLKVLAAALVVAFAFASPADAAKARKHKEIAIASTATRATPQHWGTNLFPAGPLYWNGVIYMGDDPDPNIQFPLWRDVVGPMGGARQTTSVACAVLRAQIPS